MSIESQDVYLNSEVPMAVIGGGGSIPQNLEVSTLSALGIVNISSINGVAYTGAGAVPPDLVLSSLSTSVGITTRSLQVLESNFGGVFFNNDQGNDPTIEIRNIANGVSTLMTMNNTSFNTSLGRNGPGILRTTINGTTSNIGFFVPDGIGGTAVSYFSTVSTAAGLQTGLTTPFLTIPSVPENGAIVLSPDSGGFGTSQQIQFQTAGHSSINTGIITAQAAFIVSRFEPGGLNLDNKGLQLLALSTLSNPCQPMQMSKLYLNPGSPSDDILNNDSGALTYNSTLSTLCAYPALSVSSINCSTLNGISINEIPNVFDSVGPVDTASFGGTGASQSIALLTQNISTIAQHRYLQQGVFSLSTISAPWPAPVNDTEANATITIRGGGGGGPGLTTNCSWTYRQLSTLYQTLPGGVSAIDLSWLAPGWHGRISGTSTIQYTLNAVPEWPQAMYVGVSTLINNPLTFDTYELSTTDLGLAD